MRLLSTAALILALSAGMPVSAGQDPILAPATEPNRTVRSPAEPSDVLIHSPLAPCGNDSVPGVASTPRPLRIVTWNIRAARSAPVDDIAAELRAMEADVIALQEVDLRTRRTGFVDEPAALSAALGFQYVFAASIKYQEGDYGLAVLSRWPLVDVRRYRLDATDAIEARIVLEVTVCARGRLLRVFNHHADGRATSRDAGLDTLKAIARTDVGHGVVVVGDFNERADGPGLRGLIDGGLVDLGAESQEDTNNSGRIDYILTDGVLAHLASAARVWPTDKSDHNAVLADIVW